MRLLVSALGLFLFFGCFSEGVKHEQFMEHSDIYIYRCEVISEEIEGGRVEYLDSNKNPNAWKHSKSHFIFYKDSLYIHVFKEHPKSNLELIQTFITKYTSDSTQLSTFVRNDTTIKLILKYKYSGTHHEKATGDFFDKEELIYKLKNDYWQFDTSSYFAENSYPWK